MMETGGIFMLFICYPKCSTCKKAKKFLTDHQIEFDERHIVEENPSLEVITIFFRTTFKPFLSICRFYRLFLYF